MTRLMQERDVRLDAADAEFLQAALHAPGGVDEAQAVGRHLDQQRIVERRDDRAGEGRAGVEADAHAAGRAVMAEPAVVGQEVVGRVLGRHPALDGEAVRARPSSWSPRPISGSASGRPWAIEDLALDDVEAGDLLR